MTDRNLIEVLEAAGIPDPQIDRYSWGIYWYSEVGGVFREGQVDKNMRVLEWPFPHGKPVRLKAIGATHI